MLLWADVVKQSPMTQNAIVPVTKTWGGIVEGQIETYTEKCSKEAKAFKKMDFWLDTVDSAGKSSLV